MTQLTAVNDGRVEFGDLYTGEDVVYYRRGGGWSKTYVWRRRPTRG
ncbi:MAG: hypothetical protein LC800_12645 [Acidobacteria bacterium]|nr:hypothetical protein [Acidobacteriota bacterium]